MPPAHSTDPDVVSPTLDSSAATGTPSSNEDDLLFMGDDDQDDIFNPGTQLPKFIGATDSSPCISPTSPSWEFYADCDDSSASPTDSEILYGMGRLLPNGLHCNELNDSPLQTRDEIRSQEALREARAAVAAWPVRSSAASIFERPVAGA